MTYKIAICAILPFAVLLRGNLKEQLRILGSPACLEPCRAKPIGLAVPVRSKFIRRSIVMNQNFTVRKLARCAVVAALYVVLCMALQPFSYGAVQVRVAEALCLLPVVLVVLAEHLHQRVVAVFQSEKGVLHLLT